MIVQNINNENDHSPEILLELIKFLKNCDFNYLKEGEYQLYEDKIKLIFSEYETEEIYEKKPEQHRRYIDIQYIIYGQESIGISYPNNENEAISEFNVEKDVVLFNKVVDEFFISLKSGMYVVIFPYEIHRPNLSDGGKHRIKKAVIKLDNDLFSKSIKDLVLKINKID